MTTGRHALRLGGRPAVGIFVVSLLAFVAETQLSQYVQSDLGFEQPYLLFYVVHSAFAILFPVHLLYLIATTQYSTSSLCRSVIAALQQHLSPTSQSLANRRHSPTFPTRRFLLLVLFLTSIMTGPSLLWFIAVTLAPITDVTALWNTNAFFAYVFSVMLSGVKWDVRRLIAVLIATTGALVVVYGGATAEPDDSDASTGHPSKTSEQEGTKAPLIGDLLTLVASIVYGVYQVLYKKYVALPNDPEVQTDSSYAPLAASSDELPEDVEPALNETSSMQSMQEEIIHPLPFGLYPNLLTSAIGICTLLIFWLPVPVLDILGVEPFALPRTAATYGVIAGIALSGAIFNAGFMVLLGVWGPIVTSVGSLLTIVLVFISDTIFGGAADTITVWSVLGCGSIIIAFGMLAYDMMKGR